VEPGAEGLTSGPPEIVRYCDSSALARTYLADEAGHGELSRLLLDPANLVVTSALTEVELVAAVRAAARAGRVADADVALAEAVADMGPAGPIAIIALDSARVLPRARDLCERHHLRVLDAIHLAVALEAAAEAPDDEIGFVTRDADQAAAARAEGLRVE
jgi:predicted nucleic acid-binding protein